MGLCPVVCEDWYLLRRRRKRSLVLVVEGTGSNRFPEKEVKLSQIQRRSVEWRTAVPRSRSRSQFRETTLVGGTTRNEGQVFRILCVPCRVRHPRRKSMHCVHVTCRCTQYFVLSLWTQRQRCSEVKSRNIYTYSTKVTTLSQRERYFTRQYQYRHSRKIFEISGDVHPFVFNII